MLHFAFLFIIILYINFDYLYIFVLFLLLLMLIWLLHGGNSPLKREERLDDFLFRKTWVYEYENFLD